MHMFSGQSGQISIRTGLLLLLSALIKVFLMECIRRAFKCGKESTDAEGLAEAIAGRGFK